MIGHRKRAITYASTVATSTKRNTKKREVLIVDRRKIKCLPSASALQISEGGHVLRVIAKEEKIYFVV